MVKQTAQDGGTYELLPSECTAPIPSNPPGGITEQEVKEWLKKEDNYEKALSVLKSISRDAPDLWREVVIASEASQSFAMARKSMMKRASYKRLAKVGEEAVKRSVRDTGEPVLLFASNMYFAEEHAGYLDIEILRLGCCDVPSEVHYRTEDGSAIAGQAYEKASGCVAFESGERCKSVRIYLKNNENWDTTLEFKVVLISDDVVNGIIDQHLSESLIRLMNDDPFPTNEHKDLLLEGKAEEVPRLTLWKAYVALNGRNRTIWWRKARNMVVDQLHNVKLAVSLFMNVYLFDHALNTKRGDEELFMHSRYCALFLVVAWNLVPFAILHFLEFLCAAMTGVQGPSRQTLQCSMLRQYFQVKEEFRTTLGATGLLTQMLADTDHVVHAYLESQAIGKSLGELAAIACFICFSPYVFNTPFRPFPLVMMCIFPILMLGFLAIRGSKTERVLTKSAEHTLALCKFVDQTCGNYWMITTFAQQAYTDNLFVKYVKERNSAMTVAGTVRLNNLYFASWLSIVISSCYTIVGGMSVIEGNLTLGYLVTNLKIFSIMGDTWCGVYESLTAIQEAFPSLHRITNFLNMPTDVAEQQERSRRNNALSRENVAELDDTPIILENIQVYFTSMRGLRSPRVGDATEDDERIAFEQGQIVAITSPRAGGKSTLLKLIGGVIQIRVDAPTRISIPGQVRTLWVSVHPLFFQATVAENLVFGASSAEKKTEHIMHVCKTLGLSQELLVMISMEENNADWVQQMSSTNLRLLNLARALIANPDLLCLERPLNMLDSKSAYKVMDAFKLFILQRGFSAEYDKDLRRRRTVVITAEKMTAVDRADTVFYLDKTYSLKAVDKEEFSEAMFSAED